VGARSGGGTFYVWPVRIFHGQIRPNPNPNTFFDNGNNSPRPADLKKLYILEIP